MDQLLLPYLKATDEQEETLHLDRLLLSNAAPVVRKFLRLRLNLSVNSRGHNSSNQDAEDLYQEAMTRTVQWLRELRNSPKPEIESFTQYVGRITANVCNDFLRAKTPSRSRLKNNLRELLSRHPDFDFWKVGGKSYCGLASWHEKKIPVASERKISELEMNPGAFLLTSLRREETSRSELSRTVSLILTWLGGAVEIDALVRVIAILMDVNDTPIESLDEADRADKESPLVDTMLVSDFALEARAILGEIWQSLLRFSPNQRNTYCYAFEDKNREDLFTLLLKARVVTLPELLQQLGWTYQELVHVWSRMPMNNEDIASELKATRAQVNRWRFNARKRMTKEFQLCTKKD